MEQRLQSITAQAQHMASGDAVSPNPPNTSSRENGHPTWCSLEHCHHTDDGVRVHEQRPVRWEEPELRFESRLFFADGELPPTTYLQLSIDNLRLTWRCIDAFLPIAAARRLRDQLTAHLEAADPPDPGRRSTAL